MKKNTVLVLSLILILALVISCNLNDDSEPRPDVTIVSIGDSITMGIQSAGLAIDFQENTYPNLVAEQLGVPFNQPDIRNPGIGIPPYYLPIGFVDGELDIRYLLQYTDDGEITEEEVEEILPLIVLKLKNYFYANTDFSKLVPLTPYNNLGVNGAKLHDIMNTTSTADSEGGNNFFFDIVLRNEHPNLEEDILLGGTTAAEQALMLEPDLIFLWIGNNDILGSLLGGGDPELITLEEVFRSGFEELLLYLLTSEADILVANLPSYHIPFLHALDGVFIDGEPVIFDPKTFEPIDFGDDLYIPLLINEPAIKHLLFSGAIAYMDHGYGIPDNAAITALGGDPALVPEPSLGTEGIGLPISDNDPLTEDIIDTTITQAEYDTIFAAVESFNTIIEELVNEYELHLVDTNSLLDPGAENPLEGYSEEFALFEPERTIFSLDGVHPNNLGHALVANAFIEILNSELDYDIPLLNPVDFIGQYGSSE